MQNVEKDVKLGGNIVGTVNVPIYDTVDELIDAEDDSRILACFNGGNKIRIMTAERTIHQDKPLSKQKKLMLGLAALTTDELQQVAGDMDAMQDLALSDDVQSRIATPETATADDGAEVEVEDEAVEE